jgi:hypothetical protein
MKKSAMLVVFPKGVLTEIRPDEVAAGTLVAIVVAVVELIVARLVLKITLLFAMVV